jgi:hypothetical protein
MALAILDAGRQVDVVARLLADKRSENTRRAYRHDLADFFATMTGAPATPDNVQDFLSLNRGQGNAAVMDYKAVAAGRRASTSDLFLPLVAPHMISDSTAMATSAQAARLRRSLPVFDNRYTSQTR